MTGARTSQSGFRLVGISLPQVMLGTEEVSFFCKVLCPTFCHLSSLPTHALFPVGETSRLCVFPPSSAYLSISPVRDVYRMSFSHEFPVIRQASEAS